MAEKRPKSILSGLKKMLHRDAEKPSEPAPKKSSVSTRKKSAAPAKEAKAQPPAAPSAEPPAAAHETSAEPKPEKKKVQNQPWYRHRQRW
jgi:hypothetical protein